MTGRARAITFLVVGFVVLVVVLNLIANGLDDSVGGSEPTGAPNSTYSRTASGVAGYFELLTRWDHPVDRIRGDIGDEALDPADTVMVIAPAILLSEDDEFALEEFVQSGGRLVWAGTDDGFLDRVLGSAAPTETLGATRYTEFAAGLPLLDDVQVDGTRGYEPGDFTPIATEDGTVLAASTTVGAGEVVFVADESLFHNEWLATADNAAFAVELAGEPGRTVVFAEGVHGYGQETGLDAIPTRWRYALAFLVLAAVLYAWARGRRLGPPDRPRRDLPPARGEYVTALGTTLGRTSDRAAALATVGTHARASVARRAGLSPDVDRAAFDAAARGLGLTDDEIAALWDAPRDDIGVMRLGRAAARATDGRVRP